MPIANLGGVHLHHRVDGPGAAPWLMLCNSLGTSLEMWDRQAEAFARHFRVLRYDHRGHGRSSVPPAPYSMADLAGDVLRLMDHLDVREAALCGLSLGGVTAQWLAVHAQQRFSRFVFCSTGAKIGTPESWAERIAQVRAHGMVPMADAAIARWLTPEFASAQPATARALHEQVRATSPEGYIGCMQALAEVDLRAELAGIDRPVLTVAGSLDAVTTPAALQEIAERIGGACSIRVHGAHLCNVESADAFNDAVLAFLRE